MFLFLFCLFHLVSQRDGISREVLVIEVQRFMQNIELYKCLFLMKLGIVALNVNIVEDYIASIYTLPIGVMVGGLIGCLVLIPTMVGFYLFKPIIFNPYYVKRKNDCSLPLSLTMILLTNSKLSNLTFPSLREKILTTTLLVIYMLGNRIQNVIMFLCKDLSSFNMVIYI